ncbi:sugar-binding transcriptional regulator [Cetobacterium sp. 2A]|uniref:sugar-binding transcriptional regulator n=1 Tax=unclassified Cetobacterium TaxID=2630983 RepID=UPI00163C3E18|nr:sugar-binding domain-containing protein [Cetobacterium sp. 2A]MBC2857322.1 sugar-binding transcriptional regulator [Cetobacterium sp. 2A]
MNSYEQNLIFKITWSYFMENKTQQEISEMYNISRAKIMKLLSEAKEQKIIQFKISSDASNFISLEQKIKLKYSLKDVFITPSNTVDINETIAKSAAMFIQENLSENDFLNIGFGDTVSKIVSNISFEENNSTSLISLTGGVNYYLSSLDSFNRKKTNLYIIPCPFSLSSEELANQLFKENSVNEILKMSQFAKMTVIGIGAISKYDTIVKDQKLSSNEIVVLKNKGVVADILGYFINNAGEEVEDNFSKKIISTHFNSLKNLKNVIAVAGGEHKYEAIKAALKTNIIDILFTDENTAIYLAKD